MTSMIKLASPFRENTIIAPTHYSLRDTISDALVTMEVGEDSTLSVESMHLLCRAYIAAIRAAPDFTEGTNRYFLGDAARRRFRESAALAVQAHFPEEDPESDIIPEWPAALPLDVALPRSLLDHVASVLGMHTAMSAHCFRDYMAQHGGACLS